MSNIAEIEAAIQNLPTRQVEELACWLQAFRQKRVTPPQVEGWLKHARGAAVPGKKTDEILAITRGEE